MLFGTDIQVQVSSPKRKIKKRNKWSNNNLNKKLICKRVGNIWASLVAEMVKNLPALQETRFNPWVGKIP